MKQRLAYLKDTYSIPEASNGIFVLSGDTSMLSDWGKVWKYCVLLERLTIVDLLQQLGYKGEKEMVIP